LRVIPSQSPPDCLPGIYAAQIARGEEPTPAPRSSALGSLVHYITHAEVKHFQPANMTFDLLEPLEEELRKKIRDKKERHRLQCERALAAFDGWRTAQISPIRSRLSARSAPAGELQT
jgi:methylenetetrahydrofolate--tRNA-(uracil-5-)-methyltransferase